MQTAFHVYALVKELKDCIIGATFKETEFYKKEREAYLHFKTARGTMALGLVYHPHGFGVFLIPRGRVKVETKEKPWPFFQTAYGCHVAEVEQLGFDRVIGVKLEKDGAFYEIIIEAIGPNGNYWLLKGGRRVVATLRNKIYDPNLPYQPPAGLNKLNPFDVQRQQLLSVFRNSSQTVETALRKNIIGLDEFLVDDILSKAGLDNLASAAQVSDDDIERIVTVIREIAHLFDTYDHGYFYRLGEHNLVYPFRMKTLGDDFVRCKSLSFAVYEALRTKKAGKAEVDEQHYILESVRKYVKRLQKRAAGIELDLKEAGNYELYKKFAELIKISLPSLKKGQTSVELTDVYAENGSKVAIALDPALTPAQNADLYFKKHRKGRESAELLRRRLEITRKELNRINHLQSEMERDFDTALQKYESEISEIIPRTTRGKEVTPRLPYKEYALSTGAIVYVGRDGADNDTTTFHHAKPYELWFHASQCPGSHVVLKFPDKSFEPSKSEIEEAAAIAAHFSKAKNSGVVPVIYTQRKYVHKPRNAKPGLVSVQREKTILIVPKKPSG
jgi:predicted ribosome quality control (RQC) complex YloA/Tae2 family protein